MHVYKNKKILQIKQMIDYKQLIPIKKKLI